ncbi:MAG: multiheme c-type cytochrome, partial [Gammaproteobacteria bacterium]|nr:multiheme c-type cytochrome [Gammaproteobacteria bacterium]
MAHWLYGRHVLVSLALCFANSPLWAARISDVAGTKHNLSVSGPGPVKAVTEDEICVFCHTPHGAEPIAAPLWNRELSGATYTPYASSSINASDIAATPGGSSKLCLSCHDGTLAIGAVNVANGQVSPTIAMTGTGAGGTIAEGAGPQTGFTRKLGVNLTNDHPISFTYDSALASADGELRDPSLEPHIGNRSPGVRPVVPLEVGKLECSSCHDPHIRDTNISLNIKFLRLNRFQLTAPSGGAFSETNDQVCIACHDKLGQAWALSAHADVNVADEIYKDADASLREFPTGIRVWEAACLNCHDTHTVEGSRRLLREATDSLGIPKTGGDSALEEACYQCHTNAAESILLNVTQVPNIKTDFLLPRHMPIESSDQLPNLVEVHDVTNADGSESQLLLGKGNLDNRHAECTDCHNPHRVLKNRLFNGTGTTVAGTHAHESGHTNIASGTLRGAWGVEPLYGSASFHVLPSNYVVKSGDGGIGASTAVIATHVTREYQVCLKCHSDFGYNDNNIYPTGNRPNLGDSGGSSTPGTNGLTQYTNQGREFQAPANHKGQTTTTDSGAGSGYSLNNHRSWHPVIDNTGRSAAVRNMSASTNLFLAPWDGANIGTQTMYCSDCHGSNTANGTVVPTGG